MHVVFHAPGHKPSSGQKRGPPRSAGSADIWEYAHSMVCAFFHYGKLDGWDQSARSAQIKGRDRMTHHNQRIAIHLCHNPGCLNALHIIYGTNQSNQDMLYLPHLPQLSAFPNLCVHDPEYYWLVLEATKEWLIEELDAKGILQGTAFTVSKARRDGFQKARSILTAHLEKVASDPA